MQNNFARASTRLMQQLGQACATIGYLVYNLWPTMCPIIKHSRPNTTFARASRPAWVHGRIVLVYNIPMYTRYPIVARALGRVRARAKVSCIQNVPYRRARGQEAECARKQGYLAYKNSSSYHRYFYWVYGSQGIRWLFIIRNILIYICNGGIQT